MTDLVRTDDIQAQIDRLEQEMLSQPQSLVDLPLAHYFPPGMYVREIFMPAGTLLTSKIHKTEHMFIVLTGRVSVYIDGVGVQHIQAPFIGHTLPGTRRVLFIHEDCRWVTFHPTPDGEQDLEVLEERLIEQHLLPDGTNANKLYKALLEQQDELAVLPGSYEYMGAP